MNALVIFLVLFIAGNLLAQESPTAETSAPELTSGLQSSLQPAIRVQLEQALRSRDYARAEVLLADEIGHHHRGPSDVPPGRLRLATKPVATASPAFAMTIGTVRIAILAA